MFEHVLQLTDSKTLSDNVKLKHKMKTNIFVIKKQVGRGAGAEIIINLAKVLRTTSTALKFLNDLQ